MGRALVNPQPTAPIATVDVTTPSPSLLKTDKDVYNWAFAHNITTLPLAQARLQDGILRYEAAKMIVNFVENVMEEGIMHNPLCNIDAYGDNQLFDDEMRIYLVKICDLGLM